MFYYDGLRLKSDWHLETYDIGGSWTWFKCDRSYLQGEYTPSKLLQLFFGDNLSIATDGWISTMDVSGWETIYGESADPSDGDWLGEYTETWRQSITVAYLIGAVISNLPPISVKVDGVGGIGTIAGFLDWNKPWGLTYDVDVMYKPPVDISAGYTITLGAAPGEDMSTVVDTGLTTELAGRDWVEVQDIESNEQTTYPSQAFQDMTAWRAGEYSVNDRPVAGTYAIEALGYDAYDKIGIPTEDEYYLDANEAMHSNEIYRYNTDRMASRGLSSAPSFTTTSPPGEPGALRLNWQYPSSVLDEFAGAYHASYDHRDSRTVTTHPDYVGDWCKVQDQEYLDMVSAIDTACDIIGPEAQTSVEFPERFINHIQRKKKIPNNMVSAFGYVPGAMYTATAKDSDVWLVTDTASYDPVTGEVMRGITDIDTIDWDPDADSALGVEGGYGTRGEEEGWGAGGGEDWDPDDTDDPTRASWWDDD